MQTLFCYPIISCSNRVFCQLHTAMSSFPEVAIETGHHVCGHCRLPVAGPDVVMLLCNHYLCVECVEHLSQQMNRRWCLPCQRLGCQAKFALPLSPHSQCSPTPTVHQQCVPDRYAEHVALIGVLDGGSKIRGLALLENALYVASNKNYLLKFDVPDGFERAPVRHEPQQLAAGIKWPRGVAVCQKYATVYVVDWSKLFGGSMWVIRENETSSSTVDIDFQPFGVSVSETAAADDGGARIFVSCATPAVGNPTIVVYADDGDVVRKVAALRLPSDFEIPRHVVRLPNIFVDEFAVCHGWTRLRNHRVSIVRKAAGSDVRLEETSAYGTGSTSFSSVSCDMNKYFPLNASIMMSFPSLC